jgi:hypothetical protein
MVMRIAVKRNRKNEAITAARLEAALAIVARAIVLDGPVYAPIFERLEREIAALRAEDDVVARAQRYLEAYAADGAGGIGHRWVSSGSEKEKFDTELPIASLRGPP